MSRDDLLGINLKVMKIVGQGIRDNAPNASLNCITNPSTRWSLGAAEISACPAQGRAAWPRSGQRALPPLPRRGIRRLDEGRTAFVLGGHGDTMVPSVRYSTVRGIRCPTCGDG